MVELEAGQVWRPTTRTEGPRILREVSENAVAYAGYGYIDHPEICPVETFRRWITRHGARLVTDDGAGGEG